MAINLHMKCFHKFHPKILARHPLSQANPQATCHQPPFLKRRLHSTVPCVSQVKNKESFAASQLFAATQHGNPQGNKRLHSYPARGFTFVMVLAAMLILALASQGVLTVLSTQAQQERRLEQQRIEAIYAKALKAYYNASPGTRKQYPETLEDLLLDKRQVTIQRHLRRLYADPLQPQVPAEAAWDMTRDGAGRIQAITSKVPAVVQP